MPRETVFVALLRGVNVGGHAIVPMKRLQEICASLGWNNVRTLLNSGNITFTSATPSSDLEHQLEEAITAEFGLDIAVIVRSASALRTSIANAPFAGEREKEPSKVTICFSKSPPDKEAPKIIAPYAKAGETAILSGKVLWLYYPNGMGRSKITPSILDRATGSPSTCRNWNTLAKLLQLVKQ